MAKKVQTKSTEEILWDSANKLRGSVEPSEYKHVVLSLIFLKFASDKFIRRRETLMAEGRGAFLEIPEFCPKNPDGHISSKMPSRKTLR
jgi:type I restriction enzyme M protein